MKSLEELQKIKERALERRRLGGETARVRIVVAMGTCGIAAGARDTMKALLDEIERKQLTDVVVTQTGCIGLCEYEPIVQVKVGDEAMVTYGKVDTLRAARIIEEHVIKGTPVTDWLVK